MAGGRARRAHRRDAHPCLLVRRRRAGRDRRDRRTHPHPRRTAGRRDGDARPALIPRRSRARGRDVGRARPARFTTAALVLQARCLGCSPRSAPGSPARGAAATPWRGVWRRSSPWPSSLIAGFGLAGPFSLAGIVTHAGLARRLRWAALALGAVHAMAPGGWRGVGRLGGIAPWIVAAAGPARAFNAPHAAVLAKAGGAGAQLRGAHDPRPRLGRRYAARRPRPRGDPRPPRPRAARHAGNGGGGRHDAGDAGGGGPARLGAAGRRLLGRVADLCRRCASASSACWAGRDDAPPLPPPPARALRRGGALWSGARRRRPSGPLGLGSERDRLFPPRLRSKCCWRAPRPGFRPPTATGRRISTRTTCHVFRRSWKNTAPSATSPSRSTSRPRP